MRASGSMVSNSSDTNITAKRCWLAALFPGVPAGKGQWGISKALHIILENRLIFQGSNQCSHQFSFNMYRQYYFVTSFCSNFSLHARRVGRSESWRPFPRYDLHLVRTSPKVPCSKLVQKMVGRRWKDHVVFRHQNVSVSRFSWDIQWGFKDSKHGEFI